MKLFTIGFTKKSAEEFFTKLTKAGVKRIVDIRLNNVSQLAGFTKKDDLRFLANAVCGIEYIHLPELAPTQEILGEYKKKGGDWFVFERAFCELITKRRIEEIVRPDLLEDACLLCSEEKPQHCHRRLVAEYLRTKWGGVDIRHIE